MNGKTTTTILAALFLCAGILSSQDGFITHTVRWFDDLVLISKKYDVPEDVIMKINKLESRELVTRQELKIPTSREFWPSDAEDTVSHSDTVSPADSVARADSLTVTDSLTICPTRDVSVGLMLPFTTETESVNNNNLDFYSGVLLAAKELGEQDSLDIKLNVFDFSKGLGSATGVEANDIVIGPIRSEDIQSCLDSFSGHTVIVSPLDHRIDGELAHRTNLVQAASMPLAQYAAAMLWSKEYQSRAVNNILLWCEQDKELMEEVSRMMDENGMIYTKCQCDVTAEIENWENVCLSGLPNNVFIAINNEAILGNALRSIGVYAKTYEIRVFCNGKAHSFESISTENMHAISAHCLCSYFVDYKDERTMSFVRKFRALFNCEPSPYAFQGYDTAYYIIKTYSKYGSNWRYLIQNEPQMDLLQSSIKLERIPGGGLENIAVRKVEYTPDFKLILR